MSRVVTAAMRVDWENPGHTGVTVFVGRNPGARGHSGSLVFRSDELTELGGMDGEGRLVIPFEMIDNRSDEHEPQEPTQTEVETIGVLRTKPTEPVELHVGDRVQMRNNWGVLCHYRVVRRLDLSASTNDYADPPMLEPCPSDDEAMRGKVVP